ncbi:hypothetical protein HZS_5262 [Henneguya salminicola]|nr:hypothetical protein HZS_5262 [Henneguya salminicola]
MRKRSKDIKNSHSWFSGFESITEFQENLKCSVDSSHTYGSKPSKKDKNQIKKILKNLNNFIKQTLKSHEGLVYYKKTTIFALKDKAINLVLSIYEDLFKFFNDINFSAKKEKYLIYSPENLKEKVEIIF